MAQIAVDDTIKPNAANLIAQLKKWVLSRILVSGEKTAALNGSR
jgi:Cu+-exporting ATPase